MPKGIEVCGEKLVVWRGEEGFSVLRDVCSHRQAPLSEGRVDPLTKCLECPYHGVQFDGKGACTKIPQLDEGLAIPKAANVASFPVLQTGDMLWAQLPVAAGRDFPTRPDELFPLLHNVSSFTTRDLPYSLDYLLENFMDPAHIPFAHHSLQGVRSDGSPIPMMQLESSEQAIEIAYNDSIRGKPREGVVSFKPPLYYHFRVKSGPAGLFRIMLLALCVPVRPGWSRIHLALAPGINLPLPKFILHAMTNRFLDSDLWVHEQERVGRGYVNSLVPAQSKSAGVGGYVMPTSSDLGVKSFRKWWDANMKQHPVFGEQPAALIGPISIDEQRDRWATHAVHCVMCRDALRNAKAMRRLVPVAMLAVLALAQRPLVRLAAVAVAVAAEAVCRIVIRGVLGAERGASVSTARIP